MWGTGIFGESLRPKQIRQIDGLFKTISVGGSFSVLVDNNNKAYLWGNNSDKPSSQYGGASDIPTFIQSLEGKEIV